MAINWDESLPKDSDFYATHANSLRTLKMAIASSLAKSMNWPGSGGGTLSSTGSVKAGMARSYYTWQSQYSTLASSTTVGDTSLATAFTPAAPFYVASDTSHAFSQNWASSTTSTSGSTATTYNFSGTTLWIGSPNGIEYPTYEGVLVRRVYSSSTSIAADVNGVFGSQDSVLFSMDLGTAYAAPPNVTVSLWLEASTGTGAVLEASVMPTAITASKASVLFSVLSRGTTRPGAPSQCTAHIMLLSYGTVAG